MIALDVDFDVAFASERLVEWGPRRKDGGAAWRVLHGGGPADWQALPGPPNLKTLTILGAIDPPLALGQTKADGGDTEIGYLVDEAGSLPIPYSIAGASAAVDGTHGTLVSTFHSVVTASRLRCSSRPAPKPTAVFTTTPPIAELIPPPTRTSEP